ncbi:MAG TPA: hypothetical protein VEV41_25575 [Terriglobales bacterium]|nr:hypothetical protein [Terriglobales bacterium]
MESLAWLQSLKGKYSHQANAKVIYGERSSAQGEAIITRCQDQLRPR